MTMLLPVQVTEAGRSDHGSNEIKLVDGALNTITLDGISDALVKFAASHLYEHLELRIELKPY